MFGVACLCLRIFVDVVCFRCLDMCVVVCCLLFVVCWLMSVVVVVVYDFR